jgi:hypothetical protein
VLVSPALIHRQIRWLQYHYYIVVRIKNMDIRAHCRFVGGACFFANNIPSLELIEGIHAHRIVHEQLVPLRYAEGPFVNAKIFKPTAQVLCKGYTFFRWGWLIN